MKMVEEKKQSEYVKLNSKVVGLSFFILLLLLISSFYFSYTGRVSLNVCNADAQNLTYQLKDLNSQLENSNSQVQSLTSQLQTCQGQLNQFKSSFDYYYSSLMHPTNPTIKETAANIIRDFYNSSDCLSYGTKAGCLAYSPIGSCLSGYTTTQQYCQTPNSAKQIYSSLNNKLDVGLSTGMQHYYVGALIANYYYVRDNTQYVLGASGTQTDLETLNLKAGKCDEQAVLLSSLLRSVGIDAHLVSVPGINHMITAARFEGYTANMIPGQTITVNGTDYFLMDTVCGSCNFGTLPLMDNNQTMQVLKYYNVN